MIEVFKFASLYGLEIFATMLLTAALAGAAILALSFVAGMIQGLIGKRKKKED